MGCKTGNNRSNHLFIRMFFHHFIHRKIQTRKIFFTPLMKDFFFSLDPVLSFTTLMKDFFFSLDPVLSFTTLMKDFFFSLDPVLSFTTLMKDFFFLLDPILSFTTLMKDFFFSHIRLKKQCPAYKKRAMNINAIFTISGQYFQPQIIHKSVPKTVTKAMNRA